MCSLEQTLLNQFNSLIDPKILESITFLIKNKMAKHNVVVKVNPGYTIY